MRMRQTIGLGLAALVAGPLVAMGTAGTASAAVPARAGSVVDSACGVDLATVDRAPLVLRLHGLHRVYPAGGGWSRARLGLRNRLSGPCAGVRPVMVFGARAGGLRRGDVRLQWRRGTRGGWRPVRLKAENGVLAGQVGPDAGLTVPAGGRAGVPLRLRIGRGAPLGQWLTMAVGFEPVALQGQPVPLPVGVSEPYLFRVVRGGHRPAGGSAAGVSAAGYWEHGGPGRGPRSAEAQLAETGDDTGVVAGAAAALLLGGGLVLLRRSAG